MKYLKTVFGAILLYAGSITSFAQNTNKIPEEYFPPFHIGVGIGLDYGGIGFKIEYLPIKKIGFFGAGGYNANNVGVNAGVQFRPFPDQKLQPLVMGMYGYNAVINLAPNSLANQNGTYYGPSAGLGGELLVGEKKNRLYLGIWYPFRSKRFKENYNYVKNSPDNDTELYLTPITFSIGFNWVL